MAINNTDGMLEDVKPLKSYKTGTYFYPKSVLRSIMMSDTDLRTLDTTIYKKIYVQNNDEIETSVGEFCIPFTISNETEDKDLYASYYLKFIENTDTVVLNIGDGYQQRSKPVDGKLHVNILPIKSGLISLQNASNYYSYSTIQPNSSTNESIAIILPSKTGTLALNEDLNNVSDKLENTINEIIPTYLARDGTNTMNANISYLLSNLSTKTFLITDIFDGNDNGLHVAFGGGASTIVAAGECVSEYQSNIGINSEILYLLSDNSIHFISNLQSDRNAPKEAVLDEQLRFYPSITNTGSIGMSEKVWSNMYATYFNGDLVGKFKTARNLKIGSTSKPFDGSTNVTWTLAEIGAAARASTDNASAKSAVKLDGFTSGASSNDITTLSMWVNSSGDPVHSDLTGGTVINRMNAKVASEEGTGSIAFVVNGTKLNMALDGKLYQSEGRYKVIDESGGTLKGTLRLEGFMKMADGANLWISSGNGIRWHEDNDEEGAEGCWSLRHSLITDSNLNSGKETQVVILGNNGTTYNINPGSYTSICSLEGKVFVNNNWSKTVDTSAGSDRRLKDEIDANLDKYEEAFMELKPITFKYKNIYNDNEKPVQFGYYAQDVIEAFTNHGIEWEDYNLVVKSTVIEDNEREYIEEGTDLLMMNYKELIPLNTHMTQKALREIEKCNIIIESQSNEIKSLKNELSSIKEQLSSIMTKLSM